MDNIQDIIKAVIEDLAQKKPQTALDAEQLWRKSSAALGNHTRVEGINNGALKIIVDSPTRLFQLNIRRGPLLKQIQKEIPEISNLIFRVGKV